MASTRRSKPEKAKPESGSPVRSESGVALFLVIATITLLSILVTEFTYVAQVNQRMAADSLDQLKAHYLAKTGYKLSLMRLKAYAAVKGVVAQAGGDQGGGIPGVPRRLLDSIWSFPFMYPVPTEIPGLSPADKDTIKKFQDESGLQGKFSAVVESESSKYNLNLLLAPFAPTEPQPGPSASPSPGPSGTPGAAKFDPAVARTSLQEYLGRILDAKFQADEDFADQYRDLRLEDLIDDLAAWADRSYEKRGGANREVYPPKKAPFFSVTELHMIPGMDDQLYSLFAPSLTVSTTPGINVNTMKEHTLRALVPQMTQKEQIEEFFKFRDSDTEDNAFKTADDFFEYLKANVFGNDDQELGDYKTQLTQRNLRIVTDETEFKITVQASVNNSTKTLEAWVTLGSQAKDSKSKPKTPAVPAGLPQTTNPDGSKQVPDPGLRVTFMRIL